MRPHRVLLLSLSWCGLVANAAAQESNGGYDGANSRGRILGFLFADIALTPESPVTSLALAHAPATTRLGRA